MKALKIDRPKTRPKTRQLKPIHLSALRTHLGSDLGAINRELKHALVNVKVIPHTKTIEKEDSK